MKKDIQLIWFKEKFKVDKRTSHLSSLIVSDQLTRDEALELYNKPAYDKIQMQKDISFVLSKLNISWEEFDDILHRPPKQHTDYKTSYFLNLLHNPNRLLFFRKCKKILDKRC